MTTSSAGRRSACDPGHWRPAARDVLAEFPEQQEGESRDQGPADSESHGHVDRRVRGARLARSAFEMPAPAIASTPMKAAWRTVRYFLSASCADDGSAASFMSIRDAPSYLPAKEPDRRRRAPFFGTKFVAAVPGTIPAMWASDPIAARLPVLVTKRAAASTLGPMDPVANSRPASSPGVQHVQRVRSAASVRLGLQRQQTHLRAIAVYDHDAVPGGGQRRNRLSRDLD